MSVTTESLQDNREPRRLDARINFGLPLCLLVAEAILALIWDRTRATSVLVFMGLVFVAGLWAWVLYVVGMPAHLAALLKGSSRPERRGEALPPSHPDARSLIASLDIEEIVANVRRELTKQCMETAWTQDRIERAAIDAREMMVKLRQSLRPEPVVIRSHTARRVKADADSTWALDFCRLLSECVPSTDPVAVGYAIKYILGSRQEAQRTV